MPERRRAPHLLVAGVTTRALALSAVRAGYRVTAIDAFADLDLEAAAQQVLLARPRSPGEPYGPMETAEAGANVSARLTTYTSNFENFPRCRCPAGPGDGNSSEIHPRRCGEPGIRWSSCESFGAAAAMSSVAEPSTERSLPTGNLAA